MSGDQIFWICISGIIGGCVVIAIPLIGLFWHAIIRDTKILELKIELVRQGFTAEDVDKVVRASVEPETKPKTLLTAEDLTKELADQGYSAEDIVQIIQALPKNSDHLRTPPQVKA